MHYMAPITTSQQWVADMSVGDILSRYLSHSYKSITASYESSSLVNWQPPMLNNWVQPYKGLLTYASLPMEPPISLLSGIVNNPSLVPDSWWYAPSTCPALFLKHNDRYLMQYSSHLGYPCFLHPYLSGFNTSYLLFLSLLLVNIVCLFCTKHTGFICTTEPQDVAEAFDGQFPSVDEPWILALLWAQAEGCTHSPRLGFKSNK